MFETTAEAYKWATWDCAMHLLLLLLREHQTVAFSLLAVIKGSFKDVLCQHSNQVAVARDSHV